MPRKLTYDKAYDELENIFNEIESHEVPLEKLAQKIGRANELVKFCKEKLRDIEYDVDSMIDEEE